MDVTLFTKKRYELIVILSVYAMQVLFTNAKPKVMIVKCTPGHIQAWIST